MPALAPRLILAALLLVAAAGLPNSARAALSFGPLEGEVAQAACTLELGGETREREPVLCERARWDDGSARGGEAEELFYVTATGFGAIRIEDMARSGAPRRRARTWASASGAQPVAGTAACVVAPDGTLWAWVALAPSVYAVAGVNMTTLSIVHRGTPLDVALLSGGAQSAALGPATWDAATQTVYAASETPPGAPLPPNFSPLLLAHHVPSDTNTLTNYDLAALFDADAFDMTGARIAALEAPPGSATVAYAVCGFPAQLLRRGGVPFAIATPPLVFTLNSADLDDGEAFTINGPTQRLSCGAHVRSGCANARLSAFTLPFVSLKPGVGVVAYVEADVLYSFVVQAGYTVAVDSTSAGNHRYAARHARGACMWFQNNTALVSTALVGGAATQFSYWRLSNRTVLPAAIEWSLNKRALQLAADEPSLPSGAGTAQRGDDLGVGRNATTVRRLWPGASRAMITSAARAATLGGPSSAVPPSGAGRPYFAWLQRDAAAADEAAAAEPRQAARIIDGAPVLDATAAPYQCLIYLPSGGTCTCQILDAWHVVTAAHCVALGNVLVDTSLTTAYIVYAGSTARSNGDAQGTTTTARRSATHPRACRTLATGDCVDVAVVKLDAPLTFSARQQPIAYARRRGDGAALGDVVRVVGWGLFNDALPAGGLHTYESRVVSESIHPEDTRSVRMFTTRDDGGIKSACSGDSGGAATLREEHTGRERIVGIVSVVYFGAGGGCRQGTTLFVDITEAAAWLDQRARFAYTTPFPRPVTQPSRQSGHLLVHVPPTDADADDDGDDNHGGHRSIRRRRHAILVGTNEPTALDNGGRRQQGPRLGAVVIELAANAAESAACFDLGPTDALLGSAASDHAPNGHTPSGGVGAGALLLWCLGAIVVFVALAALSHRPYRRAAR